MAVVALVTGALPLACAAWLGVEADVLVVGELVGGRWAGAVVMAANRPSGLVPYWTGWNNLMGFIGQALGRGAGSGLV